MKINGRNRNETVKMEQASFYCGINSWDSETSNLGKKAASNYKVVVVIEGLTMEPTYVNNNKQNLYADMTVTFSLVTWVRYRK